MASISLYTLYNHNIYVKTRKKIPYKKKKKTYFLNKFTYLFFFLSLFRTVVAEGGGRWGIGEKKILCSTTYTLRYVRVLAQHNYKNGCTKSAWNPVFSRTATVTKTREKKLVVVLGALFPVRK